MTVEEYKEGVKLLLQILDTRLEQQPLSEEETQSLINYNNSCSIHVFPDLQYCKACKGIIVAMTCKEGTPL